MRQKKRGGGMTPYRSGPGMGHYGGPEVIIPEVIHPSSGHSSGYGYGGGGYQQHSYQPANWNGVNQCVPLYAVDPTAPYSTFTALRSIASSIRRRGPFALAELVVAAYLILAGSAFALNMFAGRPMRLTNVPIFDPTATGANIAWFMRPVVGVAADMSLDAQVEMFSAEDAEVKRDGLGQSKYAVQWEAGD